MSPLLTNDQSPLCGPLHAHINAYLKLLEERGYKQHTIRPDSFLLADLDGNRSVMTGFAAAHG